MKLFLVMSGGCKNWTERLLEEGKILPCGEMLFMLFSSFQTETEGPKERVYVRLAKKFLHFQLQVW